MRLSATFRDPAVMLALYRGGAVGEWASLPGWRGGAGGPFGAGPAVILLPGWKPVASSSLGRVARGQDELGGEPLRGMKSTGSGRTALREAAAALRGQSWTSGRSSWHQDVTFIRRSAGWRIKRVNWPARINRPSAAHAPTSEPFQAEMVAAIGQTPKSMLCVPQTPAPCRGERNGRLPSWRRICGGPRRQFSWGCEHSSAALESRLAAKAARA